MKLKVLEMFMALAGKTRYFVFMYLQLPIHLLGKSVFF